MAYFDLGKLNLA